MQLIDSSAGLAAAEGALNGATRLFVDTEFESNRQGKLLCLVQVSQGQQVFVIDTLRLQNLAKLARVFGRAGIEWVLHAGSQDIELLVDRLGVRPERIFDTQIAWALLGPEHSVSLPYLVYRLLGVRLRKGYQADDWKRRPLPADQLAYACADIEYLPALHASLSQRLEQLGRLEAVFDASREAAWPEPEPALPLRLDAFRNAWQLDRGSQAALRFLVDWYNALSPEEQTRAPETKTLLSIAARLPANADELARIKGVPRRWAADHGEHLTAQLARASTEADNSGFNPAEPPSYASYDEIRLEAWLGLARAELCAELSVAPELALPQRILRRMRDAILKSRDIAAGASALVGWRERLLATSFEAYCRRAPPTLAAPV
jgi:ribonuclease D